MDVLTQKFNVAERRGDLQQYIINEAQLTSHIIFTDDFLCFCKANVRSIKAISEFIIEFSNFSDLLPNPSKSAIYLSWSCGDAQDILSILNYLRIYLSIKHLGLLIMGRELRFMIHSNLIDQLSSYLMQWRTWNLSYGGRLQLVKWVLYGKLQYWFQGMQLLKGVLDKVGKIVYTAIWNGEIDVT